MNCRDWTRTALILVFALAVVAASASTGFVAGWYLRPAVAPPPAAAPEDVQERFDTFWHVWTILDREFDREAPLDTQQMVYGAIDGMVRSLGDPATLFAEPSQAELLEQDLEGSFYGIGASVDLVDGQFVIVEPLQDYPALQVGLLPGDVILEVDGTSLQGMDLLDVVALIRGPEGTQVRLLIYREGERSPFEVVVTRARIELPTVSYRMLGDGIAYLRLVEFNGQAGARLKEALQDLRVQSPRALVLDLRGNPGGYLHIAVEVASQFIESGLIVTEKDHTGRITEHRAEGNGLALDLPLAVLVDGGSASAAEIVAGAIQDAGRGVLIGRPTYGKGSVQTTHTFADGSSLRVTIARWRTPKGRQLDRDGLAPDIVVPYDPNQPTDVDPELERAVEYLSAVQPAREAGM
ncbi:MAG: S41 family peptidase [Anaerolineae bacterium]|nr:S41 family peptidase [Anaerolineae bacterium]